MPPVGYVPLPARGIIALSGPDADALLQGLISSDVTKVTEDQAGYGALLTPQGKFLFDFVILRASDGLLLDVERERLAALLQRLTMYRLRSRVQLADVSERPRGRRGARRRGRGALRSCPTRAGACRPFEDGLACVDPRLARLGVRVVLPPERLEPALQGLGLAPLEPAVYETPAAQPRHPRWQPRPRGREGDAPGERLRGAPRRRFRQGLLRRPGADRAHEVPRPRAQAPAAGGPQGPAAGARHDHPPRRARDRRDAHQPGRPRPRPAAPRPARRGRAVGDAACSPTRPR